MNLSLMSPTFLGLSLGTAVCLAALVGSARQIVFLAANLLFLGVLLGPERACSTVLFTLLGYTLVRLVLWRPRCFVPGLVAYTLLFVYLRGYSFLGWLLPADILQGIVSTIGLSFL